MNNTNKNLLLFHMLSTLLYLSFHLIIPVVAINNSYTPPDNIALNCGYRGDAVAQDGRKWSGDIPSKFIPPQQLNASSTSSASTQDSAPQIPYMTARIFHSQFTYSFPVSAGPKFIRLHFHPASYSGLNISTSFFSVTIHTYTLLRNFSASLTSRSLEETFLVKEYCLNMVTEQSLNITFDPSPGSFAFVNGIEVVSMPTNMYIDGKDVPIIGQSQKLPVGNDTALETAYRLNVGGQAISTKDDTGMFRAWDNDDHYIYGAATGQEPFHFTINITYTKVLPFTAPDILYRTARSMGTEKDINKKYNLTWFFPVDSGFYYLIKLHFCEIATEITGINQRVFEIFLNNQTADDQMDIMVYADAIGVPICRNYVVMVPEGSGGKQDVWLDLHPNTEIHAMYTDAILNGLEIFKLNRTDGSLAGPNPEPEVNSDSDSGEFKPPSDHPKKKKRTPFIVSGAVLLGGAIVLSILIFVVFRRRRGTSSGTSDSTSLWGPYTSESKKTTRPLPSDLCRYFSLPEIKSATNNFSDDLRIGVGGFGNVYKGSIDGGATPVAVKRLNPTSQQGVHEFRTEIELLSQLRHLHLVPLIGYCADHGEMLLVYDYMARGTLRDHLYNTDNPPVPWKQRLEICIGAARGLHYLHTGAKHTIIHRDVKTTNILLDEKWVAKVSDFGLSKVGPTSMSQTHVSTIVKGSLGYLDPEYYKRQQLTEKSDVYSFGVVLFEVLCARPPVDKTMERDHVCLSEWARSCHHSGTLDELVDPYLRGKIAPECLRKFGEIADSCLLDQGIERPAMGDVVWNLEFALQLQESAKESGWAHDEVVIGDDETPFVKGVKKDNDDEVVSSSNGGDSTPGMSGFVFSEIMNPKAR